MSYTQETVENAAVGVAVLDDLQKLDVFCRLGVAAAIWRRHLPADFQEWINTLEVEKLPSARIIVRAEVVRDAIEVICGSAGIPNAPNRSFLVDDATTLAREFAALMQTNMLGLRFDVINDDACTRFHIDAVAARLVCTYRGTGTQYGISIDGSEPKRIFTVPTSAPIILRGNKWPEPPASGLLHRSPPIAGQGMTRLVMVVDPVFDEDLET